MHEKPCHGVSLWVYGSLLHSCLLQARVVQPIVTPISWSMIWTARTRNGCRPTTTGRWVLCFLALQTHVIHRAIYPEVADLRAFPLVGHPAGMSRMPPFPQICPALCVLISCMGLTHQTSSCASVSTGVYVNFTGPTVRILAGSNCKQATSAAVQQLLWVAC